jgi:hypothetical protein
MKKIQLSPGLIKRHLKKVLNPVIKVEDPEQERLRLAYAKAREEVKIQEEHLKQLQQTMQLSSDNACKEEYKKSLEELTAEHDLPSEVHFEIRSRYTECDWLGKEHTICPELWVVGKDDPKSYFRNANQVSILEHMPWTEEMFKLAIEIAQETYVLDQKRKQEQEVREAYYGKGVI